MKISGAGAGVGALVGAIGRALVVLAWLGPHGAVFALPPAGIGLLVGAIAGALGRPVRGAIVGFVLSALVFELFMFACASVLGDIAGLFGNRDFGIEMLRAVLPYMLLMGAAGAAAGGIGGAVGLATMASEPPSVRPAPPASDDPAHRAAIQDLQRPERREY